MMGIFLLKKKSDTGTRLRSTTHILFFDILFSILMEKGMATHSSILTWEIPWTEDRGAWQATIHVVTRIRHNLATKPPHIYKTPSYQTG